MERKHAVFHNVTSPAVMASILRVHFVDPDGGARGTTGQRILRVADLTWGKGAFWGGGYVHPPLVRPRDADGDGPPCPFFNVYSMDLSPRNGCQVMADARHVPLKDGAVDVAVFDPPHIHAIGRTTGMQLGSDYGTLPSQDAIQQLYAAVAPELRRISGMGAIIKITDMVESGRFQPNHVIVAAATSPVLGWPADLAILDSGAVRKVREQGASHPLHLRHAHSYFLVYRWDRRDPRSVLAKKIKEREREREREG